MILSPDNAVGSTGDAAGANPANQINADQQTDTDSEKKQASDDVQPPETVKGQEGETFYLTRRLSMMLFYCRENSLTFNIYFAGVVS